MAATNSERRATAQNPARPAGPPDSPGRKRQTLGLALVVTLAVLAFSLLPGLLRSTSLPLPVLNNLQNPVRVEGFYPTESNGQDVFRWTSETAKIYLPETLSPQKIVLKVAAAYPQGVPPPRLHLRYAGQELGNWQIQGGWQRLEVAFPANLNLATASLELSVESPLTPRKGDSRTLGIALRSADLETGRLAPPGLLLTTLAFALTLLLVGRWLGFGVIQALLVSLGPTLLLALYWQFDRFYTSILVGWLVLAAGLATLVALYPQKFFPPGKDLRFTIYDLGAVSSQRSAVSGQQSAVSGQLDASNQSPSTNHYSPTTIHQPLSTKLLLFPLSSLLLLAFVFLEYGRVLDFGFHWDDYHIARPWTWSEVAGTFAGSWDALGLEPAYFRPLTVVSFALDWTLWGYQPFGYHLTNLLLHALSAILLFALLRRLGLWWLAALAGAALFVILPTNVAAATWISERSDSLAAIFMLAGLLAFSSYGRSGKLRWLILANLGLVLALCSKEIAVSLPFLFVLWGRLVQSPESRVQSPELQEGGRRFLPSYLTRKGIPPSSFLFPLSSLLPSFLLLAFYLVYRTLVLPPVPPDPAHPVNLQNLWNGYHSAVYQSFYGGDDYLSSQAAPWLTLTLLGGFGLAFVFGSRLRGSWRALWFGLGWLLVCCAPLAFLGATYTVTTRVLYLPEAGYAILAGAALSLLLDFARYSAGSWRLWPVLGLLVFLLVTPYNSLHRENQRAQRDYAPTSFNTLRWDEWIYNNPTWKAKIPERHFRTIEQKLREAGRIK